MGLKIAYSLLIATPLVGVIIVFVIPLFFVGVPSQDHFKAGLKWYEQGRFENSIEQYDKAIELKPDFAQAYVKRADAWLAREDWAKALWDYNEAINYEEQMVLKLVTREYHNFKGAMAQAHFGLAIIYESQGYSVKANTEAARAEELGYDAALIDTAIQRPVP